MHDLYRLFLKLTKMDCELPDKFDIIVVGTGMIESIVAAAASRIGKKVLHVDSNDFYGGMWASFSLEGMDKYVIKPQVSSKQTLDNIAQFTSDNEQLVDIGNDLFGIENVHHQWYIPEKVNIVKEESTAEENKSDDTSEPAVAAESISSNKVNDCEEITQETLLKQSRRFNIDLAPKLQFARGDFVELLISSNIARYSEYRSVSRVLTWLNGQLEVVPCSRSDVFSNTRVTVVEKRMLMKLLTTCMDSDNSHFVDYQNKTFYQYLKDKKLTQNLIHYVLYAISMSDRETPCLQGVANTKRFLNSLGKFGKTPLLFSMYGSGELPQAFCRLCAVFGGTYCLNRPTHSLIVNADKCLGIVCGNQRINADNFVMSVENLPEKFTGAWKKQRISRAVFVTDKSILPCEKENLTLLLFPPEEGKNSITVIELGPATGTCAQNYYIVHMYCKEVSDPVSDFSHCIRNLLQTESSDVQAEGPSLPKILWSLYFTLVGTESCDITSNLPNNLYPCTGPDLDLDYDESVRKAKDIFMKIYPDAEFLPRAPDPEEIVLCDDEEDGQQQEKNQEQQDQNQDQENECAKTEEKFDEEKTTEELTGKKIDVENLNPEPVINSNQS